MALITLQDVNDEIIECLQSDVDEANTYLLNIAKRLGVREAKIKIPPVYTVKRLGASYALYICAVRNIGKDPTTSLDTESTRQDIYAQKARFFEKEYTRLEKIVTADDFIDKEDDSGCCFSVPVWRG